MPRWITSSSGPRPESGVSPTSRYLPRRDTEVIIAALASIAGVNLEDSWESASTIVAPTMTGSSWERIVSTSGNSGTAPTYDSLGMHTTSTELVALFAELVEESSQVTSLDRPQREAWVSGLISTWRGEVNVEDSKAADAQFRAYCVGLGSELGDVLVSALDAITLHPDQDPKPIGDAAAPAPTPWRGVDAWAVTDKRPGAATSYIIGFSESESGELKKPQEPDGLEELGELESSTDHSLLAEVADGELIDLNFGDATADIVPDPDVVLEEMGREISVRADGVAAIAQHIIDAWIKAAETSAAPSRPVEVRAGLILNQMAAAARLRVVIPDCPVLPEFLSQRAEALSFTEGMSDAEVAEANSWARGVLATAMRRVTLPELSEADAQMRDELVATAARPIRGPIDHLDTADQAALCFLEWADWLGVIIGLVRGGAGVEVTPQTLIRLVNTCPEVSTSVPNEDREYVEYAFGVAIDVWDDVGVVADGRLTAAGHGALIAATQSAWGDERLG